MPTTMDDISQAAPSPAPSPAKGKGRKPVGRGVRKTKKAANKKGNRGRGGRRSKVYTNPRVQAAYERQQDLAAAFSEVAKSVKPALDMYADLNLKTLLDNPTAHQEVDEYEVLQRQLDDQLEAVLAAERRYHDLKMADVQRTYELNCEVTRLQFHVSHTHPHHRLLTSTVRIAKCLFRINSTTRPRISMMGPSTAPAYSLSYAVKVPQFM